LDIIDKKSSNLAKRLLVNLNTKYFLISFATKTLSGKPMRYKKREWLEYLLKELDYHYDIYEFDNEVFYLVRSNKQLD